MKTTTDKPTVDKVEEWYDEPRGPLSEDEEHEAWREVDEEGSLHQQAVKDGYED